MRIGLLRATPKPWAVEENMVLFERMARRAAADGVELFVTCECFLDGYCADMLPIKERFTGETRERFESVAQENNSEHLARVKAIAKELQMGIVFGYSAKAADGIRNTAILIDPDGNEIGRYAKTHLYEHDLNYEPGNGFPVFDTPWGRVGMLICADRRWPEAARALRKQDVQLIVIPTYGMKHEANTCWMRTRAYENECFLAFCHPELSLICSPEGDVAACLDTNVNGILVYDINLSQCGDTMFRLRRTDLYD